MKRLIYIILFLVVTAGCAESEKKLAGKAEKIHKSVLTLDTHCDTPMNLMKPGFDLGKRQDFGCVDFPRMIEGGLDAEFFAVFIGQGPRDDSSYFRAHNRALGIFDAIHKSVENNSGMAEIALSSDDAYRIEKDGKIAVFIGVENGYPIGKDISRIRQYYELGAR